MAPTSPRDRPDGGPRALGAVRQALARSFQSDELALSDLRFQSDGTLLIEGETSTIADKKRALRIAAVASGAIGLIDRLRVRAPMPMHDGEIRDLLTQLFALDPRFADIALYRSVDGPILQDFEAVAGDMPQAAGRLTLEVRDGVVTLDGAMPSLVRKRLAGAIAWRIPGVRDVINGLSVEPPEDDSADQLEEAVREAIDGDPLFDPGQVKVGVFGDAVHLTGLVHSLEARASAEEGAWSVLGVDEVINDIEVGPAGAAAS